MKLAPHPSSPERAPGWATLHSQRKSAHGVASTGLVSARRSARVEMSSGWVWLNTCSQRGHGPWMVREGASGVV